MIGRGLLFSASTPVLDLPSKMPKMRKSSAFDASLSEWLEAEGIVPAAAPGGIADIERVRSLLIKAAHEGRAISYSELLGQLGHRFTRPRMRALCKTLDAIDAAGLAGGEPELAVLVVRESDGLPGQGWWTTRAHDLSYSGPWTGAQAVAFVRSIQEIAFAHWR